MWNRNNAIFVIINESVNHATETTAEAEMYKGADVGVKHTFALLINGNPNTSVHSSVGLMPRFEFQQRAPRNNL